jgi:hypothetical protein
VKGVRQKAKWSSARCCNIPTHGMAALNSARHTVYCPRQSQLPSSPGTRDLPSVHGKTIVACDVVDHFGPGGGCKEPR